MLSTSLLTLLVIGLASARLTVLLVHDTILEPVRERVYLRWPPRDLLALGYEYQRKDTNGEYLPMGASRDWSMFGELLSCTRCTSVWVSGALYSLALASGLLVPGIVEAGLQFGAVTWIAAWGASKV